MINLPYLQSSVLIGIMLGDAWSVLNAIKSNAKNPKISNRNASMYFKQSFNKFEYFMEIFKIFSHYCSKLPLLRIGRRKNTITYSLEFFTLALFYWISQILLH
jgi:hypothetical protein